MGYAFMTNGRAFMVMEDGMTHCKQTKFGHEMVVVPDPAKVRHMYVSHVYYQVYVTCSSCPIRLGTSSTLHTTRRMNSHA